MSSELGESGTLVSDVMFGLAFAVKKAILSILLTSAFARPATRGALRDLSLQRPRPASKGVEHSLTALKGMHRRFTLQLVS
jgi:hypothetical protein